MPNMVYKYGLLRPVLNAQLVDEQISKAHKYYNKLVEIERERRDKVWEILLSHKTTAHLAEDVQWHEDELEKIRSEIKKIRQRSRRRSETAELRDRARAVLKNFKSARADLRRARLKLKDDTQIQARIDVVNLAAKARVIKERNRNGVFWGTYLTIENAIDAARKSGYRPHFRRWKDGAGTVAVQLQGGSSWDRVTGGIDTNLQIDLTPRRCGRGKPRPTLRLRVGSDGRKPVWAEWPVILHRDLPDGAKIMWAKVKRERLAGRDRWSLHLTLKIDSKPQYPKRDDSYVAVDIGWRQKSGTLRIAYLRGSDGAAREFLMEKRTVDGFHKISGLQSTRKKNMNEVQSWLVDWVKGRDLPGWFSERTSYLAQWQSPARLARLATEWRKNRWNGDSEAYGKISAWSKRDKHLWQWETNLRDKLLARRLDHYRVFAAELSRKYSTLIIESFNLSEMQRRAPVEENEIELSLLKLQQNEAATSILRTCLGEAFAKRGGLVIGIDPAYTTLVCHACGAADNWDPASELCHTCSKCGERWDQDDNACRNLMKRYRERRGNGGEKDGWCKIDYRGEKESKWSKLGRHKKGRSQNGMQPNRNIER